MCNLKTFLLGGSGSAPGFPCCIEGVNDASLAWPVTRPLAAGRQGASGRGSLLPHSHSEPITSLLSTEAPSEKQGSLCDICVPPPRPNNSYFSEYWVRNIAWITPPTFPRPAHAPAHTWPRGPGSTQQIKSTSTDAMAPSGPWVSFPSPHSHRTSSTTNLTHSHEISALTLKNLWHRE